MLILPHSSACAGRTFSAVNLNKTKLRRKLGFNTLNALLCAKKVVTKGWKPPMSMVTYSNRKSAGRGYKKSAAASDVTVFDFDDDF